MSDPWTSYLDHLAARGRSPATVRAVRADLHHLRQWWEAQYARPFELSGLLERDIRQWVQHRQQVDGARPSTINRGLSSVRAFARWSVAQGLLTENPVEHVATVTADPIAPSGVSDVAVDALLRAARQAPDPIQRRRDEASLALLIYAGVRIQECCDVQVRDLDLATSMLVVRHGKGGKARRIPLHPDAQWLLHRYVYEVRCPDGLPAIGSHAEQEPLVIGKLTTKPGQPWVPGVQAQSIRKRLKQLGQQASDSLRQAAQATPDVVRAAELERAAEQVAQITPHQLRHSLAWRMLKNGATLPEVQRVLGHARLSTTGVYLNPSETDLQQAIDRAGI